MGKLVVIKGPTNVELDVFLVSPTLKRDAEIEYIDDFLRPVKCFKMLKAFKSSRLNLFV